MTAHPEPITREPRAAPARFPYYSHRTLAQVEADENLTKRARLMLNGGVPYRTIARVLETSEDHVAVVAGEWRSAA